ncbi:hypothetical protein, partial [Phytoactinopolyspora halophila]|uniref:hypothetical protein n=1 Tax=Phytoactinopolyspora halophila TaxID=1981511 RepID=UPI001B8BBD6A
FGLSVETTRIYEYSTLPEFAAHLMGELEKSGQWHGSVDTGDSSDTSNSDTGDDEPPPDEADIDQVLQQVYEGEIDPDSAEKILSAIR